MSKLSFINNKEEKAKQVAAREEARKLLEDGIHNFKVNGSEIDFIKNGDTIIVKLGSKMYLGEEDIVTVWGVGISKPLAGDTFKLKVGVLDAYSKCVKDIIAQKKQILYDGYLKNDLNQYNAVISQLSVKDPDFKGRYLSEIIIKPQNLKKTI